MSLIPFALAACTQFPELEQTVPDALKDAPYPDLIVLEGVLDPAAPAPEDAIDPVAVANTLKARGGRLQRRAARLRGDVIDADARARLQEDRP